VRSAIEMDKYNTIQYIDLYDNAKVFYIDIKIEIVLCIYM